MDATAIGVIEQCLIVIEKTATLDLLRFTNDGLKRALTYAFEKVIKMNQNFKTQTDNTQNKPFAQATN